MNLPALVTLWNLTQEHQGTSGARAASAVLLGLYNGTRFPMDLTELRVLDDQYLEAAIEVIHGDSKRCQMEVHVWLNNLMGRHDFGMRFEHLAHAFTTFKRGRCKREYLKPLDPPGLIIDVSSLGGDFV